MTYKNSIPFLSFVCVCTVFFLSVSSLLQAQDKISQGKGSFVYNQYKPLADRPVIVWYYNPDTTNKNLPVVFVIHGMGRNGDGYRDAWVDIAREKNFLLIVPEFSKEHYPGTDTYNLGNMFDSTGKAIDEAKWSFSVIEPLFTYVKQLTGNTSEYYSMYGHSAGSQFVHRFLFFKQNTHAKNLITANAGWYTMPDFTTGFPYGLKNTRLTNEHLKKAFAREVVVLLGEEDTDPNGKNLRRSPEAMKQGKHRFERGHTFYNMAKQKAAELGTPFNWKLATVPGAGHSNKQMAVGAAPYI